jgi:hypothetical protein
MKFPTIKLSCFPSLVNFLTHLIHASLTYDIPKIFLPLLNLVLAETWPKGTKVPLFFPCNCWSPLLIVHIITTSHKDLSSKNSEFLFLPFNPHMVGHSCPLLIDFSLVFLHNFMFKETYNTSINLISTNSAIPLNFTQEP